MPKKKIKQPKKNGKGVGGKADVHAHEEGKRNKSLLGHNAIFTPEVIDDIHIKAQLGRYRMRGMALMKKICLLYTSPSPRDLSTSRMPSSA